MGSSLARHATICDMACHEFPTINFAEAREVESVSTQIGPVTVVAEVKVNGQQPGSADERQVCIVMQKMEDTVGGIYPELPQIMGVCLRCLLAIRAKITSPTPPPPPEFTLDIDF